MENQDKSKNTAIIAYLTIIGAVIAIFMNQEENKSAFTSFHIRQALGLFFRPDYDNNCQHFCSTFQRHQLNPHNEW